MSKLRAQHIPPQREEVPVTFKIINSKKEPVRFATISVTNRTDTLEAFKKVADSNGVALFDLVKSRQYIITVSSADYKTFEKGITINADQTTFTFVLESLSKTLNEVVVRSSRPLMHQEDDKTVVDPENLAANSTNGYEVIEKTPGLFVDQDGNIYISSLTPASVYINGREMKMSAADIATMLKSLPPDAIEKIEILRTPSAKYDASGTGGVVNVVLKKGIKIGMTGSVNAGMQQGVYGNQFTGFNLSYNDGKKSSYINANYSHRSSYETIITERIIAPDSILSQDASTKYPANSFFTSYGIANSLSKKWDVDFAGSVLYQTFDNTTNNESEIRKISTSQLIGNNLNKVSYKGNYFRISDGINFKLKIDSTGSEWSNDFYVSYDRNRINQQYNTFYYTPVTDVSSGFGTPDNDRITSTVTSDLKKKFNPKLTFETGAKSSFLSFRSRADYFEQSGGTTIKDIGRTNTFHYNENINALYLQGSQTFGKNLVLKVGSRLENTNMNGRQIIPGDTSFTIHRTDLFPYIFLSKKVITIAGYDLRAYLVYRRTITRPVYDQLNPFPKYIDPYLSEVGNPALRPQFTTNYEANISVDEKPLLAIGYNDTKDIFTNVIYRSVSDPSQAYRTYDNLGKNKEWYLRGLGAIPPGKKYFLVIGGQYNYNMYDGLYENQPLTFKKGTWTFFTYQTLKFAKRSQITLNGFIRLKGQQQFYELTPFGALNTSVNRKFLKDKLIITLSANDILATNKNNFTIKQGSINATGQRYADTRRFGINVRYNFGIRKKEETNLFNVESPEKTN
ncbi:MAG: TonB-dependent receptor [Bacteroidota bacterium]|nr:TonB-dependent receptor [Bacteroidota bacterium]